MRFTQFGDRTSKKSEKEAKKSAKNAADTKNAENVFGIVNSSLLFFLLFRIDIEVKQSRQDGSIECKISHQIHSHLTGRKKDANRIVFVVKTTIVVPDRVRTSLGLSICSLR